MDGIGRVKEAPAIVGREYDALPRAADGALRRRSASAACGNGAASVGNLEDNWRDVLKPFAAPCSNCNGMTGYRCNSCSTTFYCSRACQRSDWSTHRESCKPPEAGIVPYKYVAPPTTGSNCLGVQTESKLSSATAAVLQQASQRSADADACSICLLAYARGSGVAPERVPRKLPCAHVFCTECLQHWANRPGPTKCPVCFLVLDEGTDLLELSKRGLTEAFPVHFLPDSLDLITEENTSSSPGGVDLLSPPNTSLATPSPSTAPVYLGPKTYAETAENSSGNNKRSSSSTQSGAADDAEAMAQLEDMGFDASSARLALAAAHGDVGVAVAYLFEPSSMPTAPPSLSSQSSLSGNRSNSDSSYCRGTYSGPVPPPPPMRGLRIAPAGLPIVPDAAYEADDDDDDEDDDGCQKRSRRFAASILKSSPSPSSTLEEFEQHRQNLCQTVLGDEASGTAASADRAVAGPANVPSTSPLAGFTSSNLLALVDMGFDETEARNALVTAKYKLNGALAILTGQEDDYEESDDDDLPGLHRSNGGETGSASSAGGGSSSSASGSSSSSSSSYFDSTTTTTTSKGASGELVRRSWPAHLEVGDRVEARDNAVAGDKGSEMEEWKPGIVTEFDPTDGPKVMKTRAFSFFLSFFLSNSDWFLFQFFKARLEN